MMLVWLRIKQKGGPRISLLTDDLGLLGFSRAEQFCTASTKQTSRKFQRVYEHRLLHPHH